MGIDDARPNTGGTWVDLKETGDTVKGEFLDESERQKTFEGAVVMKRGTQTPRVEHIVRLAVDPANADDDGIRLVTCDEAAWNEILKARDELRSTEPQWGPSHAGSILALKVTGKEPAGSGFQRSYAAKWWKGTGTSSVDTTPAPQAAPPAADWDEEPF